MAVVCPGLGGDAAAFAVRVYLGTQPALAVERRLLPNMQAVAPWFATRKRVSEQAAQFIELDGASCDAETFLRYSHVYFARREVFNGLLERQLALIDSAKAVKDAQPELLQCLAECSGGADARLRWEEMRLRAAKERARGPGRKELDPMAPMERWDVLAMMRLVEEDETAVDAERRAKAFLPAADVARAAAALQQTLGGAGPVPADKKEARALERLVPRDYDKVGCVAKHRPIDVTAAFRLAGERAAPKGSTPLVRRVWGHVFRRYATEPTVLRGLSRYWAAAAAGPDSRMPLEVAEAVCRQQQLFPAMRHRMHYMLTSADHAKQAWRTEPLVPALRLAPLVGEPAAQDQLAGLLVDHFWATSGVASDPAGESATRAVQAFLRETAALEAQKQEAQLLAKARDAMAVVCPPLSEEEQHWRPEPLPEEVAEAAAEEAALEGVSDPAAAEGGAAEGAAAGEDGSAIGGEGPECEERQAEEVL